MLPLEGANQTPTGVARRGKRRDPAAIALAVLHVVAAVVIVFGGYYLLFARSVGRPVIGIAAVIGVSVGMTLTALSVITI